MNIKVVVAWIFAIIVFFTIGIFGYFNQDLLITPNDNTGETPENRIDYVSKSCIGTNDSGNITYTFRINPETNKIEILNIKYQGVVENVDLYATSANINKIVNEKRFTGVTAQIYGTTKNVQLNLSVNLLEYDKANLDEMKQELLKVGMFVDSVNDYNEYQNLITNTLNLEFTCD